jgi:hypothetical protein
LFVFVCKRAHVLFALFVLVCMRVHVLFALFVFVIQTNTNKAKKT